MSTAAPTPETGDDDQDVTTPVRRRLDGWSSLAVALLCALVGVGLALQVRLTADPDRDLRGARQADLVAILDDLDNRENLLKAEVDQLQQTKAQLESGGDQADAALEQAKDRLDDLAILAGTVPAQGPGVILDITDPKGSLPPDAIVDVIQELRAAGAEAIQIGTVRIGVSTAVTGEPGAVKVDKQLISFPVQVLAIGDPATLSAAMTIPGGVFASVKYAGGDVVVTNAQSVSITALREPDAPDYAQPATPTK